MDTTAAIALANAAAADSHITKKDSFVRMEGQQFRIIHFTFKWLLVENYSAYNRLLNMWKLKQITG